MSHMAQQLEAQGSMDSSVLTELYSYAHHPREQTSLHKQLQWMDHTA